MSGMRDFILLFVHVIVTMAAPGDSVPWLPNPRCSGISC